LTPSASRRGAMFQIQKQQKNKNKTKKKTKKKPSTAQIVRRLFYDDVLALRMFMMMTKIYVKEQEIDY
jgi:hypothetical protein